MRIAIDIDDTATYAPEFFAALTHALNGSEVVIVSYREDAEAARNTLAACGIRYDRLILATDPELGRAPHQKLPAWKAEVIRRIAADVFFEDMPEVVHLIEPPTKVFRSVTKSCVNGSLKASIIAGECRQVGSLVVETSLLENSSPGLTSVSRVRRLQRFFNQINCFSQTN